MWSVIDHSKSYVYQLCILLFNNPGAVETYVQIATYLPM